MVPNPEPLVILSQDGPVCPGEISSVKIDPPIFSFEWSGPGITWQSDGGDSIQVTTGGTYTYYGYMQNLENGCKFYKEFEIDVLEKSPPPLLRNPSDGVICPDETVDIWIEQEGSYNWFGVNGTVLGNDSLITVEDQGFYYCVFMDAEGCQMITQQVEVREYTSPSLFVYPDAILCEKEDIIINVISFGVSDVQWVNPFVSSQSTLVVDQPGVYVCEISQCGITVTDSVVIMDGSFDLVLSAPNLNLCYGDTVLLTTNPDLEFYVWNDLFYDDDTLQVSTAGDYFVSATNSLGCTETSNTLTFLQFSESFLPPIADTNVCPGASITLTHNSMYDLTWYADPAGTIPIVHNPSISFTNVMQDTFVYAAYASTNCPLAVGAVMVNVIEPLLPPLLFGDTSICIGDSLYLETRANDSLIYEWYLNDSLISMTYNTLNGDSLGIYLDSNTTITLRITDFCSTNIDSTGLFIIPKNTMQLNLDTELLCPQDPLLLFATPDFENGVLWINGAESSTSDSLLIYLNQLNQGYLVGMGVDEYGCFSVPDTVNFIIPNLTHLEIEQSGLDCFQSELSLEIHTDVTTFNWILPDQSTLTDSIIRIAEMGPDFTGSYIAFAVDQQYGCKMYDTLTLYNHPLPVFEVSNDTSLCYYYYSLSYQAPDMPYTFYWNGVEADSYETSQSENISVMTINEFGCSYTDSFYVYFSDCEVTEGPNVFTPNGDGINDYLVIDDAALLFNNCLLVLNRWGNVVYEDDYYQNTFNGYTNAGDKLNDGVYYYLFYSDCGEKKQATYQGYLHILGTD